MSKNNDTDKSTWNRVSKMHYVLAKQIAWIWFVFRKQKRSLGISSAPVYTENNIKAIDLYFKLGQEKCS